MLARPEATTTYRSEIVYAVFANILAEYKTSTYERFR
jgi:hypothetical protein